MGTCTLGQSVWEHSALFFFTRESWGAVFLPAGSTPQWEGGEASATYVLQARVLFACIRFLGTLRNFFVYVCARACAHVHCIIYACNRLP